MTSSLGVGTNTGVSLGKRPACPLWRRSSPIWRNSSPSFAQGLSCPRGQVAGSRLRWCYFYSQYRLPPSFFSTNLVFLLFQPTYHDSWEMTKAGHRGTLIAFHKPLSEHKRRTLPNPFRDHSLTVIPKPKILQEQKTTDRQPL